MVRGSVLESDELALIFHCFILACPDRWLLSLFFVAERGLGSTFKSFVSIERRTSRRREDILMTLSGIGRCFDDVLKLLTIHVFSRMRRAVFRQSYAVDGKRHLTKE
jgi:hypothetical protein